MLQNYYEYNFEMREGLGKGFLDKKNYLGKESLFN
jgi:hypothetical protein